MRGKRTKIYFDGGARPNPGTMEIAVVVGGVALVERDVGQGSAMEAEWLALIAALRWARERELIDFVLIGDAAGVVAQANGTARVRGRGAELRAQFLALVGDAPAPRIRLVKRAQNLAGIALARGHAR